MQALDLVQSLNMFRIRVHESTNFVYHFGNWHVIALNIGIEACKSEKFIVKRSLLAIA